MQRSVLLSSPRRLASSPDMTDSFLQHSSSCPGTTAMRIQSLVGGAFRVIHSESGFNATPGTFLQFWMRSEASLEPGAVELAIEASIDGGQSGEKGVRGWVKECIGLADRQSVNSSACQFVNSSIHQSINSSIHQLINPPTPTLLRAL